MKNFLRTVLAEVFATEKVDPRHQYPATVAECIDDSLRYRPEVRAAMGRFRDAGPWRGTPAEVRAKYRRLNADLASAYRIARPVLAFVGRFPCGPCCFPGSRPPLIVFPPTSAGRYAVMTYLHEFAHCLQKDERQACRWSINLFKMFFPSAFEKLEPRGHMLYVPTTPGEQTAG